ncbi:MAG: hypothetical protein V4727_06460 [Verrucomicrobiota bacterium]
MKHFAILLIASSFFVSCADQETKKPAGPVSNSSQLPWNIPQKGQGGGQFSMLPQNQYRR